MQHMSLKYRFSKKIIEVFKNVFHLYIHTFKVLLHTTLKFYSSLIDERIVCK